MNMKWRAVSRAVCLLCFIRQTEELFLGDELAGEGDVKEQRVSG